MTTSNAPPAIQIVGLSKTFDTGTVALDGVTLDIAPGSFTTLLGPSGCGKSTLLKLISGLLSPTEGTVETSFSLRGDLGFVFQDPTLMPWASVEANVAMPLDLMGLSPDEKATRVEAALKLVDLEAFANAYPRALSGGMKMRVSLARALASKPKVLLLDEPFAALDEITRNRLNDDLLRIAIEEKLTVVFVTHSVFESVYLSEHIVVMAPRPGRPFAHFDVDAPEDRDQSFRLSPGYAETCGQVSKSVEAAMAAADALSSGGLHG
jgi:NitT/TauT family transport system ATP-binding protein